MKNKYTMVTDRERADMPAEAHPVESINAAQHLAQDIAKAHFPPHQARYKADALAFTINQHLPGLHGPQNQPILQCEVAIPATVKSALDMAIEKHGHFSMTTVGVVFDRNAKDIKIPDVKYDVSCKRLGTDFER